jgi:hypothetical protein
MEKSSFLFLFLIPRIPSFSLSHDSIQYMQNLKNYSAAGQTVRIKYWLFEAVMGAWG